MSQLNRILHRRRFVAATLATAAYGLAGCTTNFPSSSQTSSANNEAKRREIDSAVTVALNQLYEQSPGSRELVQRAQGVLVFPSVYKAGFIAGAEYGEGALNVDGRPAGYYSVTSGSFGLQAGAQEKAIYILFMTPTALSQFQTSSGWQVGADASVALVTVGVGGAISTETLRQPVVGYVLTKGGLMFDASLSGTKITPLQV